MKMDNIICMLKEEPTYCLQRVFLRFALVFSLKSCFKKQKLYLWGNTLDSLLQLVHETPLKFSNFKYLQRVHTAVTFTPDEVVFTGHGLLWTDSFSTAALFKLR